QLAAIVIPHHLQAPQRIVLVLNPVRAVDPVRQLHHPRRIVVVVIRAMARTAGMVRDLAQQARRAVVRVHGSVKRAGGTGADWLSTNAIAERLLLLFVAPTLVFVGNEL